ncbi:MAG: cytidine deaminase [Phototrophicales bacterium]|nr:MAG: cytidine deaminase [Phototrophicales bacterium]
MATKPLEIIPIPAPVQQQRFDLLQTILEQLQNAEQLLQTGDVIAVSSKYAAISEGRIVELDSVIPTDRALQIATRYNMDARLVQLILENSDHVFGGIQMGFLLTHTFGIISPNAGLDRSNIPEGKVVLFPAAPYTTAENIRQFLQQHFHVKIGVILTDSWLMPGRWGTTGVALACAGFEPLQDERGQPDLFGNPMRVTQRSIADTLCICAQMVMGERDEATPIALIRHANIQLTDRSLDVKDVAIPWPMCIYVESLTSGKLPDELQKG